MQMIAGAFKNVVEVETGRFLFVVSLSAFGLSYRCSVRRLNCKDKVIFRSVYVHVNCSVSCFSRICLLHTCVRLVPVHESLKV